MMISKIAIGLTALAVCVGLGSEIGLYSAEATRLKAARGDLAKQAAAAVKVERQLDSLASGTAKLADQGNANAKAILTTLQSNGINVNVKR
jgi:hypothetical protein